MLLLYPAKKTAMTRMLRFWMILSVSWMVHDTKDWVKQTVYIRRTWARLAISLGKYATVFLAQMYAITACKCNTDSQEEISVAICLDSQAVLKTLRGARTTSNLVKETILALSVLQSVRLLWVPGHHGVEGNKIADMLAKQAACLDFVCLEPVLGLPNMLIRIYARQWADKERTKQWQAVEACRQAKMFLHGPGKRLMYCPLGLKKCDLWILVIDIWLSRV